MRWRQTKSVGDFLVGTYVSRTVRQLAADERRAHAPYDREDERAGRHRLR